MKPQPIQNKPESVEFRCACGYLWRQTVYHYDVHRCVKCGRNYWTLRPKRLGSLVADVYPGSTPVAPMAEELQQLKESVE